jgi:hypothetical protein
VGQVGLGAEDSPRTFRRADTGEERGREREDFAADGYTIDTSTNYSTHREEYVARF